MRHHHTRVFPSPGATLPHHPSNESTHPLAQKISTIRRVRPAQAAPSTADSVKGLFAQSPYQQRTGNNSVAFAPAPEIVSLTATSCPSLFPSRHMYTPCASFGAMISCPNSPSLFLSLASLCLPPPPLGRPKTYYVLSIGFIKRCVASWPAFVNEATKTKTPIAAALPRRLPTLEYPLLLQRGIAEPASYVWRHKQIEIPRAVKMGQSRKTYHGRRQRHEMKHTSRGRASYPQKISINASATGRYQKSGREKTALDYRKGNKLRK